MLNVRNSRPDLNPSEQGFVLQTLIVTAVLVLLAIGAGVVIIAITRSSSDDLQDSQGDLEGPCKPWEIFDPTLAAAGAGGGKKILPVFQFVPPKFVGGEPVASPGVGGITSSAIGCLAPCYLTLNDAQDLTLDLVLKEDRNHLPRRDQLPTLSDAELVRVRGPDPGDLKFDTTNRLPQFTPEGNGQSAKLEVQIGTVTEVRRNESLGEYRHLDRLRFDTFLLQDQGNNRLAWEWLAENTITGSVWNVTFLLLNAAQGEIRNSTTPSGVIYGTQDPPILKEATVAIRVSTDGQACEIYDTITGEILLSSRDST